MSNLHRSPSSKTMNRLIFRNRIHTRSTVDVSSTSEKGWEKHSKGSSSLEHPRHHFTSTSHQPKLLPARTEPRPPVVPRPRPRPPARPAPRPPKRPRPSPVPCTPRTRLNCTWNRASREGGDPTGLWASVLSVRLSAFGSPNRKQTQSRPRFSADLTEVLPPLCGWNSREESVVRWKSPSSFGGSLGPMEYVAAKRVQ